jgi:hypothetical protein
VIDDPPAAYTVDKSENVRRINLAIRYQMKMIQHYNVSKYQEFAGTSRFA